MTQLDQFLHECRRRADAEYMPYPFAESVEWPAAIADVRRLLALVDEMRTTLVSGCVCDEWMSEDRPCDLCSALARCETMIGNEPKGGTDGA